MIRMCSRSLQSVTALVGNVPKTAGAIVNQPQTFVESLSSIDVMVPNKSSGFLLSEIIGLQLTSKALLHFPKNQSAFGGTDISEDFKERASEPALWEIGALRRWERRITGPSSTCHSKINHRANPSFEHIVNATVDKWHSQSLQPGKIVIRNRYHWSSHVFPSVILFTTHSISVVIVSQVLEPIRRNRK